VQVDIHANEGETMATQYEIDRTCSEMQVPQHEGGLVVSLQNACAALVDARRERDAFKAELQDVRHMFDAYRQTIYGPDSEAKT